ncbi:phosphotransferase enzyme family protein [Pseudoruegeria sp. SHC-113]|uniref:phosphotransferase enzyme family protein n=1 Tax=Pseudoruegeria sp. SHC-113 TaxID=2855439 RepID=UPI0021BA6406|nr:phosphotransferase [Pseudoruegeria sp. SHC-113]MCT8158813.1 phosphotransferase [Pseudoruegeria sp. SHC-113]
MKDAEAIAFAEAALKAWEAPVQTPRLIKNRENAVFEVHGHQGTKAALRLHRPGYQSEAAILSELLWTQSLAREGLRVPRPIPTRSGALCTHVPEAGRLASMVSWMEGAQLGEGGAPLKGSAQTQVDRFTALGRELGQLHRISDGLELPPTFTRPRFDADGLLGEDPLWGRFWENPALAPDEAEALNALRPALREAIEEASDMPGGFGLIHADALRENVFVAGDTLCLIDFDDGAFGPRLYELGVAMSQNWELPNAAALAAALCAGYREEMPLSARAEALLPAFTVLRCMASCGWVIGRYAPQAPETKAYAARAIRALRAFESGDFFGAAA